MKSGELLNTVQNSSMKQDISLLAGKTKEKKDIGNANSLGSGKSSDSSQNSNQNKHKSHSPQNKKAEKIHQLVGDQVAVQSAEEKKTTTTTLGIPQERKIFLEVKLIK